MVVYVAAGQIIGILYRITDEKKDMEKNLYLIDAYAMIYRGFYAMMRSPRVNSKGQDTTAVFGFLNTFEEIVKRAEGHRLAVVFDPPGGTFRSEMYEAYKAQREKTPEGISFGIPYIKKLIDAFGIQRYEVEGYEADDVIGTIATQVGAKYPEMKIFMITPDKDYGQLVTQNVHILKPGLKGGFEELGPSEVTERYGLQNTSQVIDLLALWGDASDNVPGVKGIGEKIAAKLLGEYGDIEGIYEHIDQLKGKQKENLIEGREQLKLSRELVTIHANVPVTYALEDMLPRETNLQALADLYEELEFRSKLTKLQGNVAAPKSGGARTLFDQDEPKTTPTQVVESSFDSIDTWGAKYHLVEEEKDIDALVERLSQAKQFAFDTETDSLDGMSAGIVGISFAIEEGEAWYVPLSALSMEARIQLSVFQEVFANPNILKIGQNLKFDLKMIERFGVQPVGPYWDTMIAHYLIQPELRHGMDAMAESYLNYRPIPIEELIGAKGKNQKSMRQLAPQSIYKYASEDADVTLRLYGKLREELEREGLEDLFYKLEMPLMEVLLEMEKTGVRLDAKRLTETVEELNTELAQLEHEIYRAVQREFNINSPKEVGEVLFDHMQLVEKPKKTKTGQYVTREEELQKIAHLHPVVGMILRYRGLRKLVSTYIEPLPLLINKQTGRVHTTYNQTSTATGRLSSTDPNLQNIPVRDEDGRQLRRAFTSLHPERGDLYVSADYSQIELRLMAHFSGDEAMIEAFRSGTDIHAMTAARIYHTEPSEVSSELRRRAKTANFGIIYGISTYGLSSRLGIAFGEAKELIEGYFRTFPGVQKYMQDVVARAKEQGYVETIMGRRRFLMDINSQNSIVRGFAERNAINAPLQGSAADIIKVAMIRIQKRLQKEGFKAKMMLQVHDELNFSCPPDEKDRLVAMIREEMEGVCPELRVPLTVDVGVGENWLEAH
ncbi:DNA polymerase I [Porphyromonas levii]|nr:DNA polymerase I [Porphyromonas levii]MBR8713997.1 DNA polymerase I [Porphyromonas levii]MBR8716021.1 DNA polymerase I [Porphyromonas levii]MBR8728544.1 DNA polymerase I [Porphyromonas levii]MBR8736875.1 DNA polymerase I [Porphyromonas levii]